MRKLIAIARLGLVVLVGAAAVNLAGAEDDLVDLSDFKERAEKLAAIVAEWIDGPEDPGNTAELRAKPLLIRLPAVGHPWGHPWGSYQLDTHELFVDLSRPISVDDALFAMVYSELVRGFGAPATPWFGRGIAHALVGSAGGLPLEEIEGRTQAVTPEEVLVRSGRPALTLAPGEARLARCLLGELGVGINEAWKVDVDGQADLADRLVAAWFLSLKNSGISPMLAYPRSVGAGAYVVLGRALRDADAETQERELHRIAALCAHGVEIPVEIPLAGSADDADRRLVEMALLARASGLSVVLAPRFTPSLAPSMMGDPAAVEAYGQRRAEAVEALSWLAEFGEVDGLVLFSDAELCQPLSSKLGPELRAARRSLRRQSLVGSRPFAGDRLAFTTSESRLQSARGEDFSQEFSGALAVIDLKVGVGDTIPSLGFARVGTWDLPSEAASLSGLSDEALKELFHAPKGR